MIARPSRLFAGVLALGALACTDGAPPVAGPQAPDTTSAIVSIEMVPYQQYLDTLSVPVRTYARGYSAEGVQFSSATHPDLFSWTSSDPAVLEVDQLGTTTGRSWGVATVTAETTGGVVGSRRVNVADAIDPGWSLPLSTGAVTGGLTVGQDGLVYVGSTDFSADTTTWYAVTSEGTIGWSVKLPLSSPTIPAIGADGTLYIESRTNRPYRGRMVAVAPGGTIRWMIDTHPDDSNLTPAIGPDGTIYNAGGDRLMAISPDGEVLWTFQVEARHFQYSSPAVAQDGTVYVGGYNDLLYAINPDGSLRWTFQANDWIGSSPVIGADGTIYFGCADGEVYAVAPDGTRRWNTKIHSLQFGVQSAPAIGPDGTLYVGSNGIHAIDPAGSIRWSYPGSFHSTPLVGADGTVFSTTPVGAITAVDPQGRLLWEVVLPGEHIDATGAISPDGNIVLGSFVPNSSPPPHTTTLHSFVLNGARSGTFDEAFWPTGRGGRSNSGSAGG